MEGRLGWHNPLGQEAVDESRADDYITRQRQYDEDLWVMEVEDLQEKYSPAI